MKRSKIRVPYALAVYGKEEIAAVNKVLSDPAHITAGKNVKEFEGKIAGLFGKKRGIMVNSGSSANLLAIESLCLPPGSEVITPLLTFATTVAPLVQKGLIPVFVDVEPGTYVVNVDQIEGVITKKTRALMIPSLIGNIPDMMRLRKLARKHKLYFVEDSCDTLGATFAGKPTGYYSDISTTSFYASHIITAAASGGMVCVNNEEMAREMLIKSSWGRESTLFGAHEKSEDIGKRFAGKLNGQKYDAKFIFSKIGYNFQSTDINAAFGLEQVKKLGEFADKRRTNFAELLRFFKRYERLFILPKQNPRVTTNWLAFPLAVRPGAGFDRYELTKYLEENDIQTRPIFTGNILKQPAFRSIKHRMAGGGCPVTDDIMRNGFLIGCHHGIKTAQLDYLKNVFLRFLERYE